MTREEAREAVREAYDWGDPEYREEIIKALEQQKTGHWIGKKIIDREWKDYIVPLKDGFVTGSCSCSECGEWLTASDEYACYGNYCPNCGAKMESEDKGRNLCNSCATKGCIFQSGIVRRHCDFYKAESEVQE